MLLSPLTTTAADARRWTIRAATEADGPTVERLTKRAFGSAQDDAYAAQRWRWLFVDNVSGAPMHYLVADAGERLAGQYALIPVRMQHAGREVLGLLSVDTATDPDFERQGIFTTLARQLYGASSAALVYGFPNARSAPAFYTKLGWISLRVPKVVRPLGDISGLARALGVRVPDVANVFGPVLAAANTVEQALARLRGATVTELEDIGSWADTLWSRLAPTLGTCAIRDRRFLAWRFTAGPWRYRLHGLVRAGAITGLAVSKIRPWRGIQVAYLMELLVDPQDSVGARALVADVIRHAAAAGASALRAIVTPRHPHRSSLRRMGLIPLPARFAAEMSFGVRINGPDAVPNQALHSEDWYLSGADIDYF